jgi:hypothetical protein
MTLSEAMAEISRLRAINERLVAVHEPGCPAIADDESDEVLDDYGVCACDARQVLQAVRVLLREDGRETE